MSPCEDVCAAFLASLQMWPLQSKGPWQFLCLLWTWSWGERVKECSERPVIWAGWGLLAALRQDRPGHPIHLCHGHTLLLGDYVLVSSLCN